MSRHCTLPVEDQLMILELLSRYNVAVDEGDPDGVADCFTADGYINGRSGYSAGHEQLRKIGTKASPEYQARHIVTNTLISARSDDAETADVRSHLLFYEVTPQGMSFVASGIYTDVVVKSADGWRFRSRLMTPAIGGVWPGQRLDRT